MWCGHVSGSYSSSGEVSVMPELLGHELLHAELVLGVVRAREQRSHARNYRVWWHWHTEQSKGIVVHVWRWQQWMVSHTGRR